MSVKKWILIISAIALAIFVLPGLDLGVVGIIVILFIFGSLAYVDISIQDEKSKKYREYLKRIKSK